MGVLAWYTGYQYKGNESCICLSLVLQSVGMLFLCLSSGQLATIENGWFRWFSPAPYLGKLRWVQRLGEPRWMAATCALSSHTHSARGHAISSFGDALKGEAAEVFNPICTLHDCSNVTASFLNHSARSVHPCLWAHDTLLANLISKRFNAIKLRILLHRVVWHLLCYCFQCFAFWAELILSHLHS